MPEPSGLRPENYQFATLAQRKLLLSGGSQFLDRPCTLPANRRSPRAQHTRGRSLDLFVLPVGTRSEEHTSELQSQSNLVCRLLLEKKKNSKTRTTTIPRPVCDISGFYT